MDEKKNNEKLSDEALEQVAGGNGTRHHLPALKSYSYECQEPGCGKRYTTLDLMDRCLYCNSDKLKVTVQSLV